MGKDIKGLEERLCAWHGRMEKVNKKVRDDFAPQTEQVSFQVVEENGQVTMRFGKPIAWIAFTPEQAMKIAQDIVTGVKKVTGEPD